MRKTHSAAFTLLLAIAALCALLVSGCGGGGGGGGGSTSTTFDTVTGNLYSNFNSEDLVGWTLTAPGATSVTTGTSGSFTILVPDATGTTTITATYGTVTNTFTYNHSQVVNGDVALGTVTISGLPGPP